jgi:hypothetical protein
MGKVFLSYAREDSYEAFKLYKKLCLNNIPVWFDREDILGGQEWATKIEEGIEQSTYFIPFLTETYFLKEGYVQVEIRSAFKKQQTMPPGKPFIIPVRFEDVEPPYREIRELNYVDLFPFYDAGLTRLLAALPDAISESPVEASPFNNYFVTKQLEQGKSCLRQGFFSGATKHFGEILKQNPENEEAWLLLCISEFNGASIKSQHSEFINKINNNLLKLINSRDPSIRRQSMFFLAILKFDYYSIKRKRCQGPDYEEIREFLLKQHPSKEELEYLNKLKFTTETRKKLNLFG